MGYKVIELEQFQVIGIYEKITPKIAQTQIGELWQNYFNNNISNQIQNKFEKNSYGIYSDYDGDFTKPYQLLIGNKIKPNSNQSLEELKTITIPKQKYAVFEKTGPFPECVINCWKEIWETDIERTYNTDFEKYYENRIEIYISID